MDLNLNVLTRGSLKLNFGHARGLMELDFRRASQRSDGFEVLVLFMPTCMGLVP